MYVGETQMQNVTWYSRQHITANTPWIAAGYHNVTLRNPDGGWVVQQDALFFSEDCPFVGM